MKWFSFATTGLLFVQLISRCMFCVLCVAGWLVDQTNDYGAAFYLSGFCLISAAVFVVLVDRLVLRKKSAEGQEGQASSEIHWPKPCDTLFYIFCNYSKSITIHSIFTCCLCVQFWWCNILPASSLHSSFVTEICTGIWILNSWYFCTKVV